MKSEAENPSVKSGKNEEESNMDAPRPEEKVESRELDMGLDVVP